MVDQDEETGKTVGWVPVGDGPEDRWFREAFNDLAEGTFELLGPKVQGNVERLERHILQAHSAAERYHDAPRTFDGLREWLHDREIGGARLPSSRRTHVEDQAAGFRDEAWRLVEAGGDRGSPMIRG
jgi:hypothetical protein